jgi:hypothetical protein
VGNRGDGRKREKGKELQQFSIKAATILGG